MIYNGFVEGTTFPQLSQKEKRVKNFKFVKNGRGQFDVAHSGKNIGTVEPSDLALDENNVLQVARWTAYTPKYAQESFETLSDAGFWLLEKAFEIAPAVDATYGFQATVDFFRQYPQALKAACNAVSRTDKIQAIKFHRAVTGCGLKESKDQVEAWQWQ